jgi:cytochrome c551/c552
MKLGLLMVAAVMAAAMLPAQDRGLLDQYCVGCHNEKLKTGGLSLDKISLEHPSDNAETWEKVIRKLRAGMMPPSGARRPDRAAIDTFVHKLEADLDRAALSNPNPGTLGLHRLNRAEYANAIRDLLDLNIDVSTLLPSDDSSEGFDNIADALGVSPALLERYVSAATKISRVAVGDPAISPSTATYRVPGDMVQSDHLEGLPLGTRGGIVIHHTFPLDAEYTFRIRARVGGLGNIRQARDEDLEVSLNDSRVALVKLTPGMEFKLPVKAGPQTLSVAIVKNTAPGDDDLWQVYLSTSGLQSVAIIGPSTPAGSGDTPSRQRIFVCHPTGTSDEIPCARKILSTLATRAFRRSATDADLETLLSFYQTGRNKVGFETGIEMALERVLVDPQFIFRFEREPDTVAAGSVYRISDLELASRLSFFMWSSIPDDELLKLAAQGKLHEPGVLEEQARRMLADPRAEALVNNFAGQWLYLREVKNARPQTRDFDENLRQSFRRETELFFDSIVREDHSVLDLLNADYTFVDERLARHYGIPDIYGSQFRRVTLNDGSRRGLLGQGSILLVTSVANRTSPVARGKWVLENILGSPPPLPPPNVPALDDVAAKAASAEPVSVRQKMELHRTNAVCAACHKIMDPIGFSLENFDLTGKWRTKDGTAPIDATGQMVDGTKLDGPASLRQALMSRSDVFVSTLTEKLLTYATGRGLKYYDMPAVRAITREAAPRDYRFSSLVVGIVKSAPFQMRKKAVTENAAVRRSTP